MVFFCEGTRNDRFVHVLTPSFPARRSSDLPHEGREKPGSPQRTTSSPEAGKAPVAASKAEARAVRRSIDACYGPALPVSARRNAGSARQIGGSAISPVRRRVILQELPPHVLAAVEAVDDRVDDARGAVDDVQRRVEAFLDHL